MKYDKDVLLLKAREIKLDWLRTIEEEDRRRKAKYERAVKSWEATSKQVSLDALKALTEKVKKNEYFDVYHPKGLISPPSPPTEVDGACSPQVKDLDVLIEVLETLADSEITAAALARAGIRDLAKTLRRPC